MFSSVLTDDLNYFLAETSSIRSPLALSCYYNYYNLIIIRALRKLVNSLSWFENPPLLASVFEFVFWFSLYAPLDLDLCNSLYFTSFLKLRNCFLCAGSFTVLYYMLYKIFYLEKNCISLTYSATEAADLLKNLSLDSQSKTLEIPEPTKKVSKNILHYGYFSWLTFANILITWILPCSLLSIQPTLGMVKTNL